MNKHITAAVFGIGLAAVAWVAWGFVSTSPLALAMTLAIAGAYLLGGHELWRFRQASATLQAALGAMPAPQEPDLSHWLSRLHPGLQLAVRQRIETGRAMLPGPALTPYLLGLLVMLGMLGTFLGMVVTFKGAVFALEASADLAAIRAALAEPIRGLSLSFGTSVAGVAASAMLGLVSALSRRERAVLLRQLDDAIATTLRPCSAAHRQALAQQALHTQAQALPLIAERLQTLMDGVAHRSEQLNQQLLGQQAQFHRDVTGAYTALATQVGTALQDSLRASAQLAGDTIKPVVESAMGAITQAAHDTHQRLLSTTQAQLHSLSAQWADASRGVSDTWAVSLQEQARQGQALIAGLDHALTGLTQRTEQASGAALAALEAALLRAQAQQQAGEQARLDALDRSAQHLAISLGARWEEAGARTLAQQAAACAALEAAAGQIAERASAQVGETLQGLTRLLQQADALVAARVATEAQWTQDQGQRMDQLAAVWRTELGALREQEASRGDAAVARLDALQAAVAQHLASLGAALEAPMSRLMHTAAEVPQAAADVIGQLRQEMARMGERDNQALAERSAMMTQLDGLLKAVSASAGQQREAITGLVGAATEVLTQAGERFADALVAQAGRVDEVAVHVAASAVELASLGEAFHQGVTLFSASNTQLTDSLQQMASAIGQSMTRSDEQLAYYVAQAREVIDLSISSQQGIVEDLRRLHGKSAALAAGVA